MTPASYAVIWSEDDGVVHAGRIELGEDRVTLVGSAGNGHGAVRCVAFSELADVKRERLGDRPGLVLERRGGDRIRLTSMSGRALLPELQERLAVGMQQRRGGARR